MAGVIRDAVANSPHLLANPRERQILRPFLSYFDVTFVRQVTSYNATLSIYFLQPHQDITNQFGIRSEIVLGISPFENIQPRTIQAIDGFMGELPARSRVDPTIYFLVTPSATGRDWIKQYASLNPQSRIAIAINTDHLLEVGVDQNFVRRAMSETLFTRDLFDEQLPLQTDLFFVGRGEVVANLVLAVKDGKNRGLFGLRKTGKTSVLFAAQRDLQRAGVHVEYYDCKLPSIRSLRWDSLLQKMLQSIRSLTGDSNAAVRTEHISEQFIDAVRLLGQRRVAFIFDEIEYISHLAKRDPHWKVEFVDFWQTLWSAQSAHRSVSFVVAGVNPTIIEEDSIDGVQNPMFGIFTSTYLTGLGNDDVPMMLAEIGGRMGLKFNSAAVTYVFNRYGGHPLLTRLVGSYMHQLAQSQSKRRPLTVDLNYLKRTETERELELSYYCRHIVSELESFYPVEYEMLEMLAVGNIADFAELALGVDYTRHLTGYGLIDSKSAGSAKISIPVVARYIHQAVAAKEKKVSALYIVPSMQREGWLKNRLVKITDHVRQIERHARTLGRCRLYGENSFPLAERFFNQTLVTNEGEYTAFINVVYKSFVEPLDNLGRSLSMRNYFWDNVSRDYPRLFEGLRRVRLYRHAEMHLLLEARVEENVQQLLAEDFLGVRLSQLDEPFFALQQKILDGLFVGALWELNELI